MWSSSQPPGTFFFCSGNAEAPTALNAFDAALLAAGIGNTNLLKISSILPPGCKEITLPEVMPAGIFLPTAWISHTSSIPGETITAAVAVAVPLDRSLPGVIMEHAASGSMEKIEQFARDQAATAMQIRCISNFDVDSIVVSHQVIACGVVFAAIVLQP